MRNYATKNCVDICQGENSFSHCHISTQFKLEIYDFRALTHAKGRKKLMVWCVACGACFKILCNQRTLVYVLLSKKSWADTSGRLLLWVIVVVRPIHVAVVTCNKKLARGFLARVGALFEIPPCVGMTKSKYYFTNTFLPFTM